MKREIRGIPNLLGFFIAGLMVVIVSGSLAGCGTGNELAPKDLKVYVTHALKTEARNLDVNRALNTEISLRVERLDIEEARRAVRDLIAACVGYFRRDNITDFTHTTLVFHVRLASDADQFVKWTTSADNMLDLVKNRMTDEEFFALCDKEENWYFMP